MPQHTTIYFYKLQVDYSWQINTIFMMWLLSFFIIFVDLLTNFVKFQLAAMIFPGVSAN